MQMQIPFLNGPIPGLNTTRGPQNLETHTAGHVVGTIKRKCRRYALDPGICSGNRLPCQYHRSGLGPFKTPHGSEQQEHPESQQPPVGQNQPSKSWLFHYEESVTNRRPALLSRCLPHPRVRELPLLLLRWTKKPAIRLLQLYSPTQSAQYNRVLWDQAHH